MSSLKYRNNSLNEFKRRLKSLREKERELDDEMKNFCDAKFLNEQLNNIITTEIVKAIKKLSRKYGFNEKEAIEIVLRSKVTETTPENLKSGNIQECEEEEADEESEGVNVFSQKTINGTKYYVKSFQVYDSLLNVVGTLDPNTNEIQLIKKDI